MQQRQQKPENAAASPHLLLQPLSAELFHPHVYFPASHDQSPTEELLSGLCRTPEGSGCAAAPDLGEQLLHLSWLVQGAQLSQRKEMREPYSSTERLREKDRSDNLS